MNKNMFDTVLVLSPHTDDGELGAGGTITKLVENGSKVTYFAFSAPREILKTECEKCLDVLGVKRFRIFDFKVRHFPESRQEILEILFDYDKKNRPDLILTPSTNDLHQDHQTVTNETLRAFKHSTILGYELPWNNILFRENCFIPLRQRHVQKKIEALWNYKTQISERHYFDKEYLRGLTRSRGAQIGEKYAEAFEAIKVVLNSF
jgi:LmbE family N-acetylglucosaminyl deacetylase